MTSFKEWREGGRSNSEKPLIRKVASTFAKINHLEQEVEELLNQLSRDHGPVHMAMEKFKTAFDVLQSTLKAAVIKHSENPERADHAPKSIESS